MKKLRFLISLPTSKNDFQLAQALSAEETAQKRAIDLEIVYADNDAVEQSTQILKAIQVPARTRPDAIVIEPASGTALPQVARAACAAGIGWAVLNRAPDYISELRRTSTAPVFSISSDHVEIGRIQGRQFRVLLPSGGSVLYIEGPSHSSSAKNRTLGMLETKPSNIQIVTLKGQWTEESAWKAVRSWLQLTTSRRAALDIVGAQDDSMAMGARKAFQEIADQGKWSSLFFTGCDGLPTTGQEWVRKGLLAATVCIPPIAGQAIENLMESIQNGTKPPEYSATASFSIPSLDALSALKGSTSAINRNRNSKLS
jgi:ribose transport system substrate-binding protein